MPYFSTRVPADYNKAERLDKYIASLPNGMNRSKLKSGVTEILVNGKKSKLSQKVSANDLIDIEWEDNIPDNIEPEDIPLDIIYEDENVTVVKKCDYFKFECVADEINLKKDNSYIKLIGEISNVTQTITDVSVKFEVHNNWTKKGSYTSDSDHKINSGNNITPTTKTTYETTSTKISLNTKYPIKVLPLIRVNSPIVFAKVSYSRKVPDSMNGKGGYVQEVVYYRFTYSDYVSTSRTTIN